MPFGKKISSVEAPRRGGLEPFQEDFLCFRLLCIILGKTVFWVAVHYIWEDCFRLLYIIFGKTLCFGLLYIIFGKTLCLRLLYVIFGKTVF